MSLLDRAVSLALPFVPKAIVRRFSSRYIAGPSIEDALRVVRDLERQGVRSTIDVLGEFVSRPDEAEANAFEYVALVKRLHAERLACANVSVKLSALGLLLDPERCLTYMRRLMETVVETDGFARIDMEDSSCTTATLDVYRALRTTYGQRVGVAIQSRLRRSLADVDALSREPASFRLCKGIYLEPRSVAFVDPELIRSNFRLLLERMFERGAQVGVATHDERLVWDALRLIERRGASRPDYEFEMLLGVDEELRGILRAAGHPVRVYVPYGEHWHPYSVRRLRENPQIAGYALRAMFRRSGRRTAAQPTPTPTP
jgi:proline dehydrogenase